MESTRELPLLKSRQEFLVSWICMAWRWKWPSLTETTESNKAWQIIVTTHWFENANYLAPLQHLVSENDFGLFGEFPLCKPKTHCFEPFLMAERRSVPMSSPKCLWGSKTFWGNGICCFHSFLFLIYFLLFLVPRYCYSWACQYWEITLSSTLWYSCRGDQQWPNCSPSNVKYYC